MQEPIDLEKNKKNVKVEDEIINNYVSFYKKIEDNIQKINSKSVTSFNKASKGLTSSLSTIAEKESTQSTYTETFKTMIDVISSSRQDLDDYENKLMAETINPPLIKFIETEIQATKELKKTYEKQNNEYEKSCSKVKEKQFIQKLTIDKLYSTMCERRKQRNLYSNSLDECLNGYSGLKSKQQFDIFDVFYKGICQQNQKLKKTHEDHKNLRSELDELTEYISSAKEMLKLSNQERFDLQEMDKYEEEICKYNPLVEVLAHPNLEICNIVLELNSEKVTMITKIFDAYQQTVPLLTSLIKKSPSFTGNQITPLFNMSKIQQFILRDFVLLHQSNLHSILFQDFVMNILSNPSFYDPSQESSVINLASLITQTIKNWNSVVVHIPSFFIYFCHVLNDHFGNIRSLTSFLYFYVFETALNDPLQYNIIDKSSIDPLVTKIFMFTSKYLESTMFAQKFTMENFASELNNQLEISNPLVISFYETILQQPKEFSSVVDVEVVWGTDLPDLEKYLCDNYHRISLVLIERMAKEKVIALADSLASLKRNEEEIKESQIIASKKLKPYGVVVTSNLKFCGEVLASPQESSPYRKTMIKKSVDMDNSRKTIIEKKNNSLSTSNSKIPTISTEKELPTENNNKHYKRSYTQNVPQSPTIQHHQENENNSENDNDDLVGSTDSEGDHIYDQNIYNEIENNHEQTQQSNPTTPNESPRIDERPQEPLKPTKKPLPSLVPKKTLRVKMDKNDDDNNNSDNPVKVKKTFRLLPKNNEGNNNPNPLPNTNSRSSPSDDLSNSSEGSSEGLRNSGNKVTYDFSHPPPIKKLPLDPSKQLLLKKTPIKKMVKNVGN